MRRVHEAIVYFRKWPSLKSQEEAIRGLEDLSSIAAKECIDEFNRLMRTVGPAVQFQVTEICIYIYNLSKMKSSQFFICNTVSYLFFFPPMLSCEGRKKDDDFLAFLLCLQLVRYTVSNSSAERSCSLEAVFAFLGTIF